MSRTGDAITMFTTTWCGYCRRLKRVLEHEDIVFDEVDIERYPEFGDRIEELTGGFRTVPTLKVGEEYLVNPSLDQVKALLTA